MHLTDIRYDPETTPLHRTRSKTLSEAFGELVDADVVSRRMEEDAPVAVYYGLTEKGRELTRVLDELDTWA